MILMLWVSAIHTGTLSQYALSQVLTDLVTFTQYTSMQMRNGLSVLLDNRNLDFLLAMPL